MENNGNNPRKRRNIQHIAVHSTGTTPHAQIKELDKLPYDFLITRGGKLLNLRPIAQGATLIELAWAGGLDREGNRVDNRTEAQNEAMFETLVCLSDRFPKAKIVPADELQTYLFPNPGFDLRAWLGAYIPAVLAA
jgi:hypothetical protein